MSGKNPADNYLVNLLARGRKLTPTQAAAVSQIIADTTPADATGDVFGDVSGSLLGPLQVHGLLGSEIAGPAADHQVLVYDDASDTWLLLDLAVESLTTAETDTTLVLAPDGAGGVEFRAETGGGITVEEEDASPSVSAVDTLQVPNDGLINDGGGTVSLEYALPHHGGKEKVSTHGATGSTETVDLAAGNVHDLTLDAATVTLTLTGATSGVACGVTVVLRQDSTGGRLVAWPGSVSWPSASAPTLATAPNAVDVVVLFTDDGGTNWYGFLAGAPGPAGATGATGSTGSTGAQGGAGGGVAIPYTFDTTTTDSDPGSGKLRLSNATQSSAVTMRADLADANGADVTAILDALDDSTSTVKGFGRLFKTSDPTKWLTFTISAVASPSGYRNVTIANVGSSASSPFSNGDAITFEFTRTGDKGDTGATGATGAAGSTPTESENFLTGDVTMTNANTYYDGPSLSLVAGTYLLTASVDVRVGSNGAFSTAKLWDGTNVYATGNTWQSATGADQSVPVSAWVVLGSTTTVKVSVAQSGAGGTIKATGLGGNGVTNKASYLLAIKFA